jgi:hypothetical protein
VEPPTAEPLPETTEVATPEVVVVVVAPIVVVIPLDPFCLAEDEEPMGIFESMVAIPLAFTQSVGKFIVGAFAVLVDTIRGILYSVASAAGVYR